MPWSSSGFRRSCSSPGADRATVRSNTPAPFRSPKTVPLNYRPMGKTELEVSEVGFPLWPVASGAWGSFSDEQAMDLLRKAYDAGINYFDVAPTVGNAAVWQALEDVKAQGKIRYYGIALGPGPGGLEEGRAAMRKHDLGCIQTYYNLLEEEPGRKFFPVALEINQGMVIRAPHAGGVLESNPDAVRFPADGDLQVKDAAWIERARKQAANLRWVYEGKGMTLSQAALKFILSEETVASALPNIHREEQLAEYTAVSDFESFSQVELGEIAEQFRRGFGV